MSTFCVRMIWSFCFCFSYFISVAFLIANPVFVSIRIISVIIAALVFFYGLPQTDAPLDYATGNFNTPVIRYALLVGIVLFQINSLFRFVKEQRKGSNLDANATATVNKSKSKQKLKKKEGGAFVNIFFINALRMKYNIIFLPSFSQLRNLPNRKTTTCPKSIKQRIKICDLEPLEKLNKINNTYQDIIKFSELFSLYLFVFVAFTSASE